MDLGLTGKRALITGSTAGIGHAIALGLAREGAHVCVTGRTQAAVDDAVRRISQAVPDARVQGVAADCASAEGAARVFAALPELDILVNNLGVYGRAAAFEIDDAQWQAMFDVNVMSGVRFVLAALAPAGFAWTSDATGPRTAGLVFAAIGVVGVLCFVEVGRRMRSSAI
jgi:NAD(P)-dependent dehydrogenase (short-subunit alcohol dehydrogenase family)